MGLCLQDYQFLCAEVTICATLVNKHLYSPNIVVKDRNETIKKDNLTKHIDYSHIT